MQDLFPWIQRLCTRTLSACGAGSHLASRSSTTTEQPSSTTTIGRTSTTLSQTPSPQTQARNAPWHRLSMWEPARLKVLPVERRVSRSVFRPARTVRRHTCRLRRKPLVGRGRYDPVPIACPQLVGDSKITPQLCVGVGGSNGQQCGVIEGTGSEIDGMGFNYRCTAGYATYPNPGTPLWTAKYSAGRSDPVSSVPVTAAWA